MSVDGTHTAPQPAPSLGDDTAARNLVHRTWDVAAGGRIEDVVRTRVYLRDASKWEPVSRAHGRVFGRILPANTLIEAQLVGDYDVEIEADAVVG